MTAWRVVRNVLTIGVGVGLLAAFVLHVLPGVRFAFVSTNDPSWRPITDSEAVVRECRELVDAVAKEVASNARRPDRELLIAEMP